MRKQCKHHCFISRRISPGAILILLEGLLQPLKLPNIHHSARMTFPEKLGISKKLKFPACATLTNKMQGEHVMAKLAICRCIYTFVYMYHVALKKLMNNLRHVDAKVHL